MPTYKSLKQMERNINKHIRATLYEKRNAFVDIAKEKVQSEVYDKYEPEEYMRTGKLAKSFKTKQITHGIEIDNTRTENGRDIAEVVEKGHYNSEGYEYVTRGAPYLLPRPFMQNAKQEIKDRKLHVTELQKGLKDKGIDTIR